MVTQASCSRLFLIGLFLCSQLVHGYEQKKSEGDAKAVRGHVFAWPFLKAEKMQPQGGTTTGGDVTLFKGAKPSWKAMQDPALDQLARDRAAILAMAGSYRVSFDFIETAGFTADYKPQKPYFSWGTERVIVLEDNPHFISLQHVMVMYMKDKDGKETGPHVMKHWRQDWTYQDQSLHEYQGDLTWEQRSLTEVQSEGRWTQAVYQVDDSPRYEVAGMWEHIDGKSTWRSDSFWRPLPRREFSVRKDYNVLAGRHEITITPNGWLHLQNNRKLNVNSESKQLLAHELGVNRYEEITSPDLKAGDASFHKTDPYWAQVRKKWQQVYTNNPTFSLHAKVDDQKLWMHHFAHASMIEKEGIEIKESSKHANDTVEKFLKNE